MQHKQYLLFHSDKGWIEANCELHHLVGLTTVFGSL